MENGQMSKDYHFEVNEFAVMSGGLRWAGVIRAADYPEALRALQEGIIEPLRSDKPSRTFAHVCTVVVPYLTPSIDCTAP
jgi:hypothetical protein